MPLMPRTPADWTQSLAISLSVSCAILFLALCGGTGSVSRYMAPSLNALFIVVGAGLAFICMVGQWRNLFFRLIALALSILTLAIGLLRPTLAE
jgi:hypothetical protein